MQIRRQLLILWMALFACLYLLGNLLYLQIASRTPNLPLNRQVVAETGLVVSEVEEEAEEAGIREGDRILSVDGISTLHNQIQLLRYQRRVRDGTPAQLRLEREGEVFEVALTWRRPASEGGFPLTGQVAFFELLIPVCLIVIAGVLLRGASDPIAGRWAALLILSQVLWFPGEPKWLWPYGLRELGYLFNSMVGPLFFFFALGLFTRFPTLLYAERRIPWVKWVLLAGLLGLGFAAFLFSVSSIYHFGLYASLAPWMGLVTTGIQFLWLACVVLICISHARIWERVTAGQWKRMKLVWIGIYAGFLPAALLLFTGRLINPEQGIFVFPSWLVMLAFLAFLAFPISLAVSLSRSGRLSTG